MKTVLTTLALSLVLATASFAATTYPEPMATGININGIAGTTDRPGQRMAVLGDFTGDKFSDLAISGGAYGSDKHIYIVKDSTTPLPTTMNIAEMWIAGKVPNAIIITETDPSTQCGRFIAGGGDFDGDKINELAFSCLNQSGVRTYYLVYGAPNLPAVIKTTDIGTVVRGQKFTFAGPTDSASDEYIAFGDINGDGKSELVFGYGPQRQLYIVNGGTTFQAGQIVTLSESYLNGKNGFTAKMAALNGYFFPFAVTLNDMNGDGKKDIVFGQVNYVFGDNRDRAFLILLGKKNIPAVVNVTEANVNGTDIARINAWNIDILDMASVDDVNGDGISDIAIADKLDYNIPTIKFMFGKLTFSPTGDLVNFDGKDGSVVDGLGFTYLLGLRPDSGREIFASRGGDWNNDGIKDVLLGSQYSKRWNSTSQRAVLLMGQRVWPAKITLNSSVVNGVKAIEFTGPKSTGYSVGYIENVYGGAGYGVDSAYVISAPHSQGTTGNVFWNNFKK